MQESMNLRDNRRLSGIQQGRRGGTARVASAFLVLLGVALPLECVLAQGVTRIACVGDSITEGTANADHRTNSWPAILGRLLQSRFPDRYETGNFGRSGATLLRKGRKPYWREDVFDAGHKFTPTEVIINLGTNDAIPDRWAAHGKEFKNDLRDLIKSYQELPSKPRIWLSNLTSIYERYPNYAAVQGVRRQAEARIRSVAADLHLSVIDLKAATAGHSGFFTDGLHPNTAGNELIAQAVFKALTGLKAPSDPSIHPRAVQGSALDLVKDGMSTAMHLGGWTQTQEYIEGKGANNKLVSSLAIRAGDFHLRARLRMLNQKNSAAGFALNGNFFGFEGARGTVFRNGPQMGGLRIMHNAPDLWERDAWIEFEAVRNGGMVWFVINGAVIDMAPISGTISHFSFDPVRSTMQIQSCDIVGATYTPAPEAASKSPSFSIPTVDLDADEGRHVVVDREDGQYLGHVTTVLLEDGKTLLAVYPKGHGRGPIVYKRSNDGGKTWSARLPTPENWASSKEVPTIHRVIDPRTGKKRLILWSGLYPARLAVSEDDGTTWSSLKPVGDWGGIVVMGFVERLKNGSYLAMFHDDGRFIGAKAARQNPVVFTLYETLSHDGGLTWETPTVVWSGSDIHLCEPGCVCALLTAVLWLSCCAKTVGAETATLSSQRTRRRRGARPLSSLHL